MAVNNHPSPLLPTHGPSQPSPGTGQEQVEAENTCATLPSLSDARTGPPQLLAQSPGTLAPRAGRGVTQSLHQPRLALQDNTSLAPAMTSQLLL